MTCKHICRNCKHWGNGSISTESRADISRYNWKWECGVIKGEVEVDIDQGSGWDAGGASVDVINTSGDFGCIRWEKWEGT